MKYTDLRYLHNKPKTIYWDVVAPRGAKLTVLQDHDLLFDQHDYKIRGLTNGIQ